MSVRNGLLAFGISATAALGGAAAINEAFHEADRHALEEFCMQNVGGNACKNVVTTPEALVNSHTANQVYGWIGVVLMGGGVIGLLGAYGETGEKDISFGSVHSSGYKPPEEDPEEGIDDPS